MRKKTIAIVSLAVIAGMCWALLVFLSAVFTGYRTLKWALGSSAYVFVQSNDLASELGVRVLEPNNPSFKVTRSEPNRVHIEWAKTKVTLKNKTCRIAQLGTGFVQVMGQLNGDKEYPTVIDTGNPMWLVVSDTVVADSALDIYPIQEMDKDVGGLCHMHRIKIGDIVITNPLCHYALGHYERRVLGRTIWKEKRMLLGLGIMRKFVYLVIDNLDGEVEFCAEGSFQADPNEPWSQYSMSIEKDELNQERLMVNMRIAGQERQVVFDTGFDGTLGIIERTWDELSDKLTVLRRGHSYFATPRGLVFYRDITVERLEVADRLIDNAIIHVKSNDTPFARGCFTLGMGYFQDAVIVLDFERGLMWIKNPQSR